MKIQVQPEGNLSSPIVLVGESPGSEEVSQGRPFIGQSGKLLNDLMTSSGIARSSCYITNVVKERPPNNDIKRFITFGRVVKYSQAYKEYEDYLYEELHNTQANVIVPLGNVALYALTRETSIGKYRGSILEWMGRKVIPTLHPSSALRNYLWRYHIAMDLRRINRESKFREIVRPDYNLIISPSFNECEQFLLNTFENKLPSAFDIECLGNHVSCFSFGNDLGSICIPLIDKQGDYFTPDQEARIWKLTACILEHPQIPIWGQNLAFDSAFVFTRYGIKIRPLEDTMVAHAIMFPDFPKGLDFITSHYTDQPYYKDDGKRYMKIGGSMESFWRYNALDSAVVYDAFPKLEHDLKCDNNYKAYRKQTDLIPALTYMNYRGIKLDLNKLEQKKAEVEQQLQELTQKLQDKCGTHINPNSSKQLQDYFYGTLGIKPYVNRKTHNPTLDETALMRIARRGYEEALIVLDIRGLAKLKGTYLDVTLDPDNRLRGSYNPVGTKQGRLSSSKSIFNTGNNMQNQPPEMKELMIADEGCILADIDLSQAENRVVAYIAPEPKMIEAFERFDAGVGPDVHRITAGWIFGINPKDVSDEKGSCELGGGAYSQRFWGKKANHGLNYALGAHLFSLLYSIPIKEAEFIIRRYLEAYPGITNYHRWIEEELRKTHSLRNLYGRKYTYRDRWGNDLFKQAYSYIPQSTVADKINQDGILILYENQDTFKHTDLLNQIHDSIVTQYSLSLGSNGIADQIMALVQSLSKPLEFRGRSFVIPAECKIGFNLKDMITIDLKSPRESIERSLKKLQQ